MESAALMTVIAGLLLLGRRWLAWQVDLGTGSFIADWARRIQEGERRATPVPIGLNPDASLAAAALNTVLFDDQNAHAEVADLRQAVARDWQELDGLLAAAQAEWAAERAVRAVHDARLESLGEALKAALESVFRLDQVELDHRLRADQHRLQGQTFRATLEQLAAGMDHFQDLLGELKDTFPRLRREEDALGRLADVGLRQGGKLALAVQGLVAHTPRLMEESRARTEQLRRFRQAADGVRDQAEALARRIEAFRVESQNRIRSFSGAQGSLRAIDHVAQQTGLLAVNAAILAQQGGGSAGLQVIGGRLRGLATQTAAGTSELEQALDQHQQGLDRETAGLWDLNEVTQNLLERVQEFLHMAGNLDHQGQDLERALETHLGLVEQVRLASDRAELSLHEIRERSAAMETALVRQWAVEAKMAPERERLSRVGSRLSEVGGDLAKLSQRNIDEVWNLLGRHQEFRRSEVYLQVARGGLGESQTASGQGESTWRRLSFARIQRRPRALQVAEALPPIGRVVAGQVRLLLLGQDALGHPEPSALEAWEGDTANQVWNLRLLKQLRNEEHRLALMEALKDSPLTACLPGTEFHIEPEGVEVRLPAPYLGFPWFLAGLGLELTVGEGSRECVSRPARPGALPVQRLLWLGPDLKADLRRDLTRLVHTWVRDDVRHEHFLPELPYEGHRPPCPWLAEGDLDVPLAEAPSLRCLGLGAEASLIHDFRDQLVAAGAVEAEGGAVLCAIGITHLHPEALLLRLFQAGAGLADPALPEFASFRARLDRDVLGGADSDPYRSAWRLLEDLQRGGWALPLPPA
jgi:methyl-accepting chemotaxis protein